jgi:hypothetical protein
MACLGAFMASSGFMKEGIRVGNLAEKLLLDRKLYKVVGETHPHQP